MTRVPSRGSDQFPLRMPDGMRESIRRDADANGRSMNSEILARLDAGAETLRDKFAGQALMGLVAFDRPSTLGLSDNLPEHFARWAYALSDAMLAERSKP